MCSWDWRSGGCGWGEAAVGYESFDGYDHGKGFDLAGHAAAGVFGIEIGEYPEAGEAFPSPSWNFTGEDAL